ncbi:Sds3-like domain-containing protein [Trichoderma austrokoningii]
MAATASASAAFPPVATGGDLEDSNISSPLSEVDDKDANDEDIEHMHLDREHLSLGPEEIRATDHGGSDSDSALSDAGSDVNSEANDTEAETLRLYDTPQAQRHRDVGIERFNDAEPFEHTPSKLRRALINGGDDDSASASGFDSHRDEDEDDEDEENDDHESPTKPVMVIVKTEEDARRDSVDRKRKRSAAAEQSDLDQPLRKRTGSMSAANGHGDDHLAAGEDDATPAANLPSGVPSPGDEEASATNQDTPQEDEIPEVARKVKRSGSKRKNVITDDADSESQAEVRDEQNDTAVEDEPEADHAEEEAEPEADEETDAAARNLEEMEKKQAAYRDWTQIEEMFGIFRDRLYKDRLQRLEEEEQSLHSPEPTHPEYLNMKQCLDDRLEQKLQAINREHEYRLKALERRAVAQRAQIWGQYFQAVREKREGALEGLNRQWYDVQSARRSAHSLPDYGLLFPKDPAQRVRNAIAYNTEVSTLAGLAKYEGFPAGPELQGASASELEADLVAMEVSRTRRVRHKPSISQIREEYQPPHLTRLDPAGEQFVKNTPWANPNHSAHKFYPHPVSAETRPEPAALAVAAAAAAVVPAGRAPQNAHPVAADPKTAIDGPGVGRSPAALSARLSESPEMTRNILNPTSHQMKRMGSMPGLSRSSKAAAA